MDGNIVIKAEQLCKFYFQTQPERKEVPALKNLNFEIKKAEILALCGNNGAGKSTLLKILSRVTAPTTGSVKGRGRINGLLEIGAGFHPELTGLENIYLNGAMLGMNKIDIKNRIEAITCFSGIQEHLNIPVKRYSSGMYMRIAFSTAIHLPAEILILDEVLAVGDHSFQQACLKKISEVNMLEGRTIILVSHDAQHLNQVCTRKITLMNGEIAL